MTIDNLIQSLTSTGWSIQHIGQDGPNCPWNCLLIKDGEFYNGRGQTCVSAIESASLAEPYIPLEREPKESETDFDIMSLLSANLRPITTNPFRGKL